MGLPLQLHSAACFPPGQSPSRAAQPVSWDLRLTVKDQRGIVARVVEVILTSVHEH